ncbi:MAG: AraC family transcriptional regulator [Nocardioidaceae bacterium]|nr:AraC family transcriptional regulator [Nocardioidaceae bacterium]
MGTSDTFSTFVESLASHLDDHDATGGDLAARMYLSRSHFDRVVGAASGETPGRFRRRVLLERAAYRLLTSRTGLLDVAVEAGYSSHEAFTRAFTRAYGAVPSQWRSAPTRIQIEAPNGVHFHPPGGLRLPARTKVTSMDLLTRMVEHHISLLGEMVDRAASLSDTYLDRPIEISVEGGVDDNPTLRSLLSRLIGQMDMWNQVIAHRDYDWSVEDGEPVDHMRRRLETVGPDFLGQVRDVVAEGRLDETFVDAHCSPPEVFTYGGLIAHVLTFAAYRRTLVVGALGHAGITDLGYGDPRKWVAEPA